MIIIERMFQDNGHGKISNQYDALVAVNTNSTGEDGDDNS